MDGWVGEELAIAIDGRKIAGQASNRWKAEIIVKCKQFLKDTLKKLWTIVAPGKGMGNLGERERLLFIVLFFFLCF